MQQSLTTSAIGRNTRRDWASRLLSGLERALLVLSFACLAWYGWTTVTIDRLQSEARTTVERMLAGRESHAPVAAPTPPETGVIGQLDIPRLHFSAPVLEGDDDRVLDFAVGHVPETPQPWRPGNSAFAAHRDRLFRPLRDIRVGDDIWLATRVGDLQYRVLRTLVVYPTDVWVLDPLPQVSLTLITCFPFFYVGHAPQRFIVQAEKVEPLRP
jgi:LPXTG-site transpeptidase (sortase) family protein